MEPVLNHMPYVTDTVIEDTQIALIQTFASAKCHVLFVKLTTYLNALGVCYKADATHTIYDIPTKCNC